jgi:hypothetical protein
MYQAQALVWLHIKLARLHMQGQEDQKFSTPLSCPPQKSAQLQEVHQF